MKVTYYYVATVALTALADELYFYSIYLENHWGQSNVDKIKDNFGI